MNKKRQRAEIGGEDGFEGWGGYMAAKKSKLKDQFQRQASNQTEGINSEIFKNVSIFVNGYTVPTADELKRIMMMHGGNYEHYLTSSNITHVIASNLPDVKIKKLKGLHANIVKPEWITACLDAGRLVDFRPFLLYSHQSTTQPSIRSFSKPISPILPVANKPPLAQKSGCENKVIDATVQKDQPVSEEIPAVLRRDSSEDLFASSEKIENNAPSTASKTLPDSELSMSNQVTGYASLSPVEGEIIEENNEVGKYDALEDQESSKDLFSSPEVDVSPEETVHSKSLKMPSRSEVKTYRSEDMSTNDERRETIAEKMKSTYLKRKEVFVENFESESNLSSGDLFTSPGAEENSTETARSISLTVPRDLEENSNETVAPISPILPPVHDVGGSEIMSPISKSDEILLEANEFGFGGCIEDLITFPGQEEVSTKDLCPITTNASMDTKATTSRGKTSAKCASDVNFLSEFYSNSRLHHISTMGAMFKQHVAEMRQKKNNFPGLQRLKEWKRKNPSRKIDLCTDEEDFSRSVNTSTKTDFHQHSGKVIMHIDMDCFFVSVGLRNHPHLKGKAVAVTHSKGNHQQPRNGCDRKLEFAFYKERVESKMKKASETNKEESAGGKLAWMEGIDETNSMAEIASCSYEARQKGVKNGMFMGAALKLCPDLVAIPYDFEGYKEVAFTLYNTVSSYTLDIEAVSCDEMFVDCTKLLTETNCSTLEFASFLRQEIKEKTHCPASTGFGPNPLMARLATRKAKPDGMHHIKTSDVAEFMKAVNVRDLPGVGRTMAMRLKEIGVSSCGDLQKVSLTELRKLGSKTGDILYAYCRGQDSRSLNFNYERKSVSAEVNYGIRFQSQDQVDVFIRQLALEVQRRLNDVKVKGRCITLKLLIRAENAPAETAKFLGHGVCDYITRSSTLSSATSDADIIARETLELLNVLHCGPSELRGIGIQITHLEKLGSTSGALDRFVVKNPEKTLRGKNELEIKSSAHLNKNKGTTYNPPQESSDGKSDERTISSVKGKTSLQKGIKPIDRYMVARKKSSRRDDVSKLPPVKDVDFDVLAALPKSIRQEILEAYSSSDTFLGSNSNEIHVLPDANGVESKHSTAPASVTSDMEISYSQVDPTFLEALPSDMRVELESEFQRRKARKEQDSKKNLKTTYEIDEQPGPSRRMILDKRPTCRRSESILWKFMSPKEVKLMLKHWITDEPFPQPCDLHMLEHYMNDLVIGKKIDELFSLFRFFYRCALGQSNFIWKKKYHDILSSVQANMQRVYHSSLHVDDFDL